MKIRRRISLFCKMPHKTIWSVFSRWEMNIFCSFIMVFTALHSRADTGLDTINHGRHWIRTFSGWIYADDLPGSELKTLQKLRRLKAIEKERYLFSVGQVLYNGSQSLAVRFQEQTGATVYEGMATGWGSNNMMRHFILSKKSNIEFVDTKITRLTAINYRFHVISNDSREILGWSTPQTFKMAADGKTEYAYLGKFNTQKNGFLKLEIYNVNNYSDRDAIIIDWRPVIKPTIVAGIEYQSKKHLMHLYYVPLMKKLKDLNTSFNGKRHKGPAYPFIPNPNEIILGDSLIRLNININYSGKCILKAELRKKINGKSELLHLEDTQGKFLLYKEYWREPGEYELTFYPALKHPGGSPIEYFQDKAISYRFKVLPALNSIRLYTTDQMVTGGIILITLFTLILVFSLNAIRSLGSKKLSQEQKSKEFTQLQMNSIRAQLNPHFMFNALAGIQNLMNKNKNEEANIYLNKFARITRNVLENKEMVSIREEVRLLDDYLQMEQLRFNFDYEIKTPDVLDHDNIEIPSMLLQPLVENAIKHGIIHKGTLGRVLVAFIADQHDLVLKVTDNGNGFDTNKSYNGLGLGLIKSRITLLNTMYKETPFLLSMQSTSELTSITITLINWL
jgi:two-component system LytT family sensor kinase